MNRGELHNLAEELAESWVNGNHTHVIEEICRQGVPVAAALAASISRELGEIFAEGASFRAALTRRAENFSA